MVGTFGVSGGAGVESDSQGDDIDFGYLGFANGEWMRPRDSLY